MLYQSTFFLIYLGNILGIIFYTIILIFAIFIYKRNSYKYGITLIVYSIIFLALNIIWISIQGADLAYRLVEESGLPGMTVSLIILTLDLTFKIITAIGMIILIVSIYLIYKTHRKDKIEQNCNLSISFVLESSKNDRFFSSERIFQ